MTKQQQKREITSTTKCILYTQLSLGQSKNFEISESSCIFVASFQPLVFAYSALTLFTANIIGVKSYHVKSKRLLREPYFAPSKQKRHILMFSKKVDFVEWTKLLVQCCLLLKLLLLSRKSFQKIYYLKWSYFFLIKIWSSPHHRKTST